MHRFDPGEIFWLAVDYEDVPDAFKIRPAIIVGEKDDNCLILVSTTSIPPNDPPKHFDQYKIPILNWRRAGLPKPSWGLGFRLIELTIAELKSIVKNEDFIGRMHELDFNYLVGEIERIHSD